MRATTLVLLLVGACGKGSATPNPPLGTFGEIQRELIELCPKYTAQARDLRLPHRTVSPGMDLECDLARPDLAGTFSIWVSMGGPQGKPAGQADRWLADEAMRSLDVYSVRLKWEGRQDAASRMGLMNLISKLARPYMDDPAALQLWDAMEIVQGAEVPNINITTSSADISLFGVAEAGTARFQMSSR